MTGRLAGIALAAALVAAAPVSAAKRIVAVTTDLAALALVVGSELVSVETIVPPSADPEAFEPRPGDINKVARADILVRVGLGYDHWLDRLLSRIAEKRLMRGGEAYVDGSLGIALLEMRGRGGSEGSGHAHGAANPHYWLDPENSRIITANIAEALIRHSPGDRERIIGNRDRFLAELDLRLQRWTAQLAPFAGTKLVAYHNTWPYFARRFRLDVAEFIEPKPGVSPSPFHISRLIANSRAIHVRAVIHEPYEPHDVSRMVAHKLGVPVVVLATSVASVPEATDYFALFDHNVDALARVLGAERR